MSREHCRFLCGALLAIVAATASSVTFGKEPRVIELQVTSKGFEPASVKVKKDEPLKLVVTRKTEKTCAKEIVVADYGIRAALPLDRPVTVTFTPKRAGEIRYACAMDMIGGVIVVQ